MYIYLGELWMFCKVEKGNTNLRLSATDIMRERERERERERVFIPSELGHCIDTWLSQQGNRMTDTVTQPTKHLSCM